MKKLSSFIAACLLSTAFNTCATKEQSEIDLQVPEQPAEQSLGEKIKFKYGDEAVAVYNQDKAFYDEQPHFFHPAYFNTTNTPPEGTILPQSYLTYNFFKQLNRFITHDQYDAAVASFISAEQRAYFFDMSEAGLEGLLVNRLGLKAFLGYVIVDQKCDCPITDYSTAKDVLESIASISVKKDTNSAKGLIEVRFKHDMLYIDHATLGKKAEQKGVTLLSGEPYFAKFTQHWDL